MNISHRLQPNHSGFPMENRLKRPLYIPLEIVHAILLRLPVKTLGRFCCVSKPWCSIISDPNFRTDHISLSQQRPLLLVINGNDTPVHFTTFSSEGSRLREFSSDTIPKCPLSGLEYPLRFRIIQSCRGLVCLELGYDACLRLCNPSTEEIAILPYPLDKGCDICAGFGYAASTEEFKVVRFYTPTSSDEEVHCEVFPMGTTTSGGWREARSPPFKPLLDSRVPLLHGALHLMPPMDSQSVDDHYIAAFDLDTEEYRGITLPEIYFREVSELDLCEASELEWHQLAVLRGSLYLVLDLVKTKETLELWRLKEYHGGEWVRQYNIDLSSAGYHSASPVEIMGDGSIFLNVRRFGRTELLCCNPRQNCFVEKKGVNCDNSQQNCFVEKKGFNCDATFYIEAFLPLKGLLVIS